MNIFKGTISNIKTSGSLSLVEVNVDGIIFKSIIIDTPETAFYLKINNDVKIIFKEAEVVISKGNLENISLQNKVSGLIIKIEKDELLSKITLKTKIGEIRSIITTDAVEQLVLKNGDEVVAMVKTNEMILSE